MTYLTLTTTACLVLNTAANLFALILKHKEGRRTPQTTKTLY